MASVWQRLGEIVGSISDRTGVVGSLANAFDPDNWLPGGKDAAFTLALIALSAKMAVSDGVVTIAGRTGGFGNYVKLSHGGGLGTGYGHMSRIAVRPGQHVSRGQVIGYIGSSGLSTGPHLHYEVYRNGVAVNPMSVAFVTRAQLEGKALADFRARIRQLTTVTPGAALAPVAAKPAEGPKLGSLADVAAKRADSGI